MYSIFNTRTPLASGIHVPPQWHYLRNAYLGEIAKIMTYYHTRVYSVRNQHFLVRLLNNINVPMQYDVAQYVNVAMTRAPFIASGMGLTSDISKGVVHPGIFYGGGSDEIILRDSDYFNPFIAAKQWRDI